MAGTSRLYVDIRYHTRQTAIIMRENVPPHGRLWELDNSGTKKGPMCQNTKRHVFGYPSARSVEHHPCRRWGFFLLCRAEIELEKLASQGGIHSHYYGTLNTISPYLVSNLYLTIIMLISPQDIKNSTESKPFALFGKPRKPPKKEKKKRRVRFKEASSRKSLQQYNYHRITMLPARVPFSFQLLALIAVPPHPLSPTPAVRFSSFGL